MNVSSSGGLSLQDLATAAQAAQSPSEQLIGKYDNVIMDGKLDQNELVNGGLDSVTAQKLLTGHDKDGDGKLSDKEIEGILSKWDKSKTEQRAAAGEEAPANSGAAGQAEAAPKAKGGSAAGAQIESPALDADGNGGVTSEEAGAFFVNTFDKSLLGLGNSDGKVSIEEYLANFEASADMQALRPEQRLQALLEEVQRFVRTDLDGNGEVTEQEAGQSYIDKNDLDRDAVVTERDSNPFAAFQAAIEGDGKLDDKEMADLRALLASASNV